MNRPTDDEGLHGHYPRPLLPKPGVIRLEGYASTVRMGLVLAGAIATVHVAVRLLAAFHEIRVWEEDLFILDAVQAIAVLGVSLVFARWVWQACENLRTLQDRPLRTSPSWSAVLVAIPLVQIVGWWFVMDQIGVLSEGAGKRLVAWYAAVTGSSDVTVWYYLWSGTILACGIWFSGMLGFGPLRPIANTSMIVAQLLGIAGAVTCDRMIRRIDADQTRLARTATVD